MKNLKVEKEVMAIIKKYQPILLLNRNTFTLKYGTENPNSLMECVCNYPYLNVTLKYSDGLAERKDKVPYVVHEMCHVITDPLFVKAIDRYSGKTEILDERELLTDYICNIVIINKA